jgi:hypothetical protein
MNGRVRAGLLLVAIAACLGAVYQLASLARLSDPRHRWTGVVAEYDRHRFAGLISSLPAGQVVGYVEDDPDGAEMNRPYYLAQYVLAPCVLVEDATTPLVVVNGRPDSPPRPPMAGGKLLRDLGNGVRLFGREGA